MDIKDMYIGQKVRVIDYEGERPGHWNSHGKMDEWCGLVVTIEYIKFTSISVKEDKQTREMRKGGWLWKPSDFEPVYPVWIKEDLWKI